MDNPINRIIIALDSYESRSKESFEYSLYLTIDMSELCYLLFEYLMEIGVRDKIIKHIKAKVKKKEESIQSDFLDKLLVEFKSSDKRRRTSLGTTIKEFKHSLTRQQRKIFFDEQVLSEKLSDRKRAYVICQDIYDDDVDESLWESWGKYTDNNCMGVLSKNSNKAKLASHFNEIWANNDLKFFIKNNVLKKVAVHNFKITEFLKEEDPISYLSACVEAKKNISDKVALSIAKNVTKINDFNYVLWCLGMLGKDRVLYKLLSQAKDLEKDMPVEFWEYIPEEYAQQSQE